MPDPILETSKAEATVKFAVVVPLQKGIYQEDGSILFHAIASSDALDWENERVPQDMVAKSFPYLERFGKINFDHGDVDIGDVQEIRRISPEEVAQHFGRRLDGENGTYVKFRVYPLGDALLAPEDLKRAHYYAQSGAKLGVSAQGTAIRQGGELVGAMVAKLALTPHPTNMDCPAVPLVKSLSEVMALAAGDAKTPDAMILCPELEATGEVESEIVTLSKGFFGALVKAIIESGYGTDVATFTQGQALRQQSLDGADKAKAGKCPKCGGRTRGGKCERCDDGMKEKPTELGKALAEVAALYKAVCSKAKKKKKKKAPLGSGERFEELEEEARKGGARDPAAVAAAAGRKKYGKKRFQELAAKGRRRESRGGGE